MINKNVFIHYENGGDEWEVESEREIERNEKKRYGERKREKER